MAKISHPPHKNSISTTANSQSSTVHHSQKKVLKRTRKSTPRDAPAQRSSVYRGVTRHRWTGRYEAHLWDKNCWNEGQNKKGRQVYLGAYDDEEAAAHAYDLAALKYWGTETVLNFPLLTYQDELKEMEGQSREEYIGYLRRKSSGFSRGVSKYRGVARHHHNGRWEARIGRVFGNKYLYLGTYATQEEAATAYDMAAIEYRGLNAVTNFDLSRYIKYLRPEEQDIPNNNNRPPSPNAGKTTSELDPKSLLEFTFPSQCSSSDQPISTPPLGPDGGDSSSSSSSNTLELLLHSSKFKDIIERKPTADPPQTPPESDRPRRCIPDDIQTYFDCTQDSDDIAEGDDGIFGYLNSFLPSSIFHYALDA
ncbi:AP2-like ethylene-responsive transcription factor At1g16060 [Cucurbita moschata]|uniref:AP2-like ethylene-responsive transcription factor At1g16060 n=1 Tax=Cucurbita moschata TaxID=3662 RepID=A0A6J1GPH6_CUCMO|nr:AP2-like ethylene-responsive transcription factor At1g16060 [Cucurbita moschata]